MKRHVAMAALAAAIAAGGSLAAEAETTKITFVLTNDLTEMEGSAARGGFARLATVLNEQRAANPNTLMVVAGDAFSPSLLSGFDQGAHMVDLFNQLGVDVFTPGNHEFDFGADAFRTRVAEARFPIVASNILEADGAIPDHLVGDLWMDVGGVRVAFYGLTTEETPVISSPGAITFQNAYATGIAKAQELRAEGADIVVAVAHVPVAVDLALFRNHAADLILSGHDEQLITEYDGRTALTEAGAQANWVVVTTLTVDKETDPTTGATTVTWYPSFDIVDTADVAPDPTMTAAVAAYSGQLDTALNVPVGPTTTQLDSRRALVMGGESAIGDLFADAIRHAVDADVAIINGGAIRGDRVYTAGTTLTRRDVLTELPFNNRTLKLEVSGAQLLSALENAFSEVGQQTGRFPQVSGLTVEVNTFARAGNRVVSVMVDGQPLDQAATYTLATNDFMAAGGDGYTILTSGRELIGLADAQLVTSQVIDYIAAAGSVAPTVEGRIVLH